MAALRERYPARDGMGHANRPWLHNALRLDAQSRRLRLSSARRCEPNTNTNRVAECYTYTDSDSHGNRNPHGDSHSYGNPNAQTYSNSETRSYPEAASYAAAPAISP